jgi:selenocysteine lyase/cysteine desulfurase
VSLDLLLACGTPAIERHVLALSNRFAAGVQALGLPLLAREPGPHLSQVVLIGGVQSPYNRAALEELFAYLARNRVKLSLGRGRLRLSFHLYNTEAEVAEVLSIARDWTRARRGPAIPPA